MVTFMAQNDEIKIDRLTLGSWQTNAYIITCRRTGESALIDAPAEPETILGALRESRPQYILMTHNHVDHIGALPEVYAALGVPLAAHPADMAGLPVSPELTLNGGERLKIGELQAEVISTPGHTEGSLCYRVGPYLLSGDTLFNAGPGRTGSPEALAQILASLNSRLFTLPGETPVFPGHGEPTTIQKEKDEYAVFASREHEPGLCGDIVWLTS